MVPGPPNQIRNLPTCNAWEFRLVHSLTSTSGGLMLVSISEAMAESRRPGMCLMARWRVAMSRQFLQPGPTQLSALLRSAPAICRKLETVRLKISASFYFWASNILHSVGLPS